MSDTRSLLSRIRAFRERLEQHRPMAENNSVGGELPCNSLNYAIAHAAASPIPEANLLTSRTPSTDPNPLPPHITHRVRQLLQEARDLIAAQRNITDDVFYMRLCSHPDTETSGDPLVKYHKGTVAATESALRLTQAFPASAEFQTRMCDGLETLFHGLRERLLISTRALEIRRRDWGRVERLTRLLVDVHARRLVSFHLFRTLAEEIVTDARQGVPLRFIQSTGRSVARYTAAHSLNVAQVVARLTGDDYEWNANPVAPVTAALMMNIGMLMIPADLFHHEEAYEAADWSEVEPHAHAGAELLGQVIPEGASLYDAVACHHERMDGTGYPCGLKGEAIPSMARLLAVADVYAALSTDRPHRLAHEPRHALTEVLRQAEIGKLDKDFAEILTKLSFHPVGTVVELTDGRIAVVVSVHTNRVNLRATSRPVVALLTDAQRRVLPRAEMLDLASAELGGIVRALTNAERRQLLSDTHPDLAH